MNEQPLPPPLPATLTDLSADDSADPDSLRIDVGSSEERYEFVQELGAGAMGRVVEARDRLFGRLVAIKHVKDSASRQHFVHEAKTSGLLNHPNIPPVYDVGVDSHGRPYYVMQLIPGRNLGEVLAGRSQYPERWRLNRLLAYFRQVCAALEYAHERGLLHLDVKPANVMIGQLEQVYLVDWGLSTPDDAAPQSIRGTPAYMSPEQAQGGRRLSAASDVFSAGCVLYEICCDGARAFPGDNATEVLPLVREGNFAQTGAWTSAPDEIKGVLRQALHVDAEARPSAAELSELVQQILDGQLDAQRRRAAAATALESARTHLARRDQLEQECNELRRLVDDGEPAQGTPFEERALWWENKRRLAEAEQGQLVTIEEATADLLEAQRHAPDDESVLRALGEFYWERLLAAEEDGDLFQTRFFETQLRRLHLPEYDKRLDAPAIVNITCPQQDAKLVLRRFAEEGPTQVAGPEQAIAVAEGHATVQVEPGSYVLQTDARAFKASYPVWAERGGTLDLVIAEPRDIPNGFVFIPGGPFFMGGDTETLGAGPRTLVDVADFCIAELPVTWDQYREYLQDRLDAGDDVTDSIPATDDGEPIWTARDGSIAIRDARGSNRAEWPIFDVTFAHAQDYIRWISKRDQREYRLPTDSEWEKAARGTDGRIFPWGNHFDSSLCSNLHATSGPAQPAPVGSYATDVSPYGVRDMAGGVREWCDSWFDEGSQMRLARGGAWNFGQVGAHCAYRSGVHWNSPHVFLGFRLAHDA